MPDQPRTPPSEFDIIRDYFQPLAAGEAGSLCLRDDAALLKPKPGEDLVVTTDTLIAGVHFLPDCDPAAIAVKALSVNLSDLAAMSAEARWYSLALALPSEWSEAWLEGFCAGLAQVQDTYRVKLTGGDTTRTPGPLTISINALGAAPSGEAITRSGAKPGDHLFVSGTIGDGYLGLKARLGEVVPGHELWFDAYERPEPRLAIGQGVRGLATAMADISDGLLADVGHIVRASNLRAVILAERIPFSEPSQAWLQGNPSGLMDLVGGGDDYELVFTAPERLSDDVLGLGQTLGICITDIGHVETGSGVDLLDAKGQKIGGLGEGGYRHF